MKLGIPVSAPCTPSARQSMSFKSIKKAGGREGKAPYILSSKKRKIRVRGDIISERGVGAEDVNVLVPHIAQLFQLMLDKACIPKCWKAAKITPLHKKGHVLDPATTLYLGCWWLSLTSEVKQAYDTNPRNKLWEHYQRICMPAHMLAFIKNLYEDHEYVLVDGLERARVETAKGTMWLKALREQLQALRMQCMLDRLLPYASRKGLSVSVAKSEVMHFNSNLKSNAQEPVFCYGAEQLANKDSFGYL
eukprot:1138215-Pelagomonas_calceolata.AAC.1